MPKIVPFKDDSTSICLGNTDSGFTVENGTDQVEMYGRLPITLDKQGLKLAEQLKEIVDSIVLVMKTKNLPEHIANVGTVDEVKNPFG